MNLKTKIFVPLAAIFMLCMATSAFADLNCVVSATPGPVPRAILNGHWENVADLLFTCTTSNANPTTEASLTLYYQGLPITNNATTVPPNPDTHRITVTNTAGACAAALDLTRIDSGLNASGISNSGSLIALTVPANAAPAACSWTVTNVLVSNSGGTTSGNPIQVNVNMVNSNGSVTLSGQPVTVVSAVLPMHSSTTNPPALVPVIVGQTAGPAQFTGLGAVLPPSASCNSVACQNNRAAFAVTVSEDHIDSWRTSTQYYNNGIGVTQPISAAPGATPGATNVLFTFSGMLPGSLIANCTLISPVGSTWNLTGNGIAGATGTTQLVAELTGGATNLTTIETLTLTCGTSTTNPAYLVGGSSGPATTAITVSMQAWSQGSALPGIGGAPAVTGGTPRYQAGTSVGPVTVVVFTGGVTGQTTMLIPFALGNGSATPPAGTFNTGISIANTTKDPTAFGTDAQGAAVDTGGNVSFVFFPFDGSASFTVTPATGSGLVGGVVPAGNSYIVNVSDLLKIPTPAVASFTGYIFVIANFTHAHGAAFLYGGDPANRIASNQDVLVIGNPGSFSRNLNFGALPIAEVTTK